MLVLGIETATMVSSLALVREGKLVGEFIFETRKNHSEQLMPHLEKLLQLAEIEKKSIEGIAVSIGPGSFTGLRIGLATAKTLAYAWDVPVVGVSTLAAQAFSCPWPEGILCPMMDAQKNNVYYGVYSCKGQMVEEWISPQVKPVVQVVGAMKEYDKPVMMLGEAALMHRSVIEEGGGLLSVAPPHVVMPRAATVALMGQDMLKNGKKDDPMLLEPLYIRRSEAEELWEKRQKEMKI